MKRKRDEAILERRVLLAVGNEPDVALYTNPVGRGYYGCIYQLLEQALPPAAWEIAHGVLMRNQLTYGLGVGSPDLVGSVCGRFWGLELKSPTGYVEPDQRTWHAAARERGCVVDVARSLDEVAAAVERERRR